MIEMSLGKEVANTSLAISSIRRYCQQGIFCLSCSLVIEPDEPEDALTLGEREALI